MYLRQTEQNTNRRKTHSGLVVLRIRSSECMQFSYSQPVRDDNSIMIISIMT